MKRIIYVGNFSVSQVNAAGKRVLNNAKIFRKLGYEVTLVGVTPDSNSTGVTIAERNFMREDFLCFEFQRSSNIRQWLNFRKMFNEFVAFISEEYGIENISHIVMYNSPTVSFFSKLLIYFCRQNEIKILSDCTEWHVTSTNNIIFDMLRNYDTNLQRKNYNKNTDGVICISTYLSEYYSEKLPTIILPPLSEKREFENYGIKNNQFTSSIPVLVYAGIPFRKGQLIRDKSSMKDRLDIIVSALYALYKQNVTMKLIIIGITEEQYLNAIPSDRLMIRELGEMIEFKGNIPHRCVEKYLLKSDFTILIRNNNIVSRAGFSTKIVESITTGIPVITTDVGDVSHYIKEKECVYFVSDVMDELILQLKEIVINFNPMDKEMKLNCQKNDQFIWSNYTNLVETFLKKI